MFRHHRRMRRFTAFCVPIILSLHTALGACSEPVSLIVPVTLYGFFYSMDFYSTTLTTILSKYTFLCIQRLDPYIRKFVSPFTDILTIAAL